MLMRAVLTPTEHSGAPEVLMEDLQTLTTVPIWRFHINLITPFYFLYISNALFFENVDALEG